MVLKQFIKYFQMKSASITVETALALPIFLGAVIAFLSFYYLLSIQEELFFVAYKVAEEASIYGYIVYNGSNEMAEEELREVEKIKELEKTKDSEKLKKSEKIKELEDVNSPENFETFILNHLYQIAGKVVDAVYFKYRIKLMINIDEVYKKWIIGGYQGINFYGSEVFSENETVIVAMQYYFSIPVFSRILPEINIKQKVIVRSFTGHKVAKKNAKDGSEDQDEMVYVTANSAVYHTNKDCTYIKLLIEEVSYFVINERRNENKGIYHRCELCKNKAMIGDIVYITMYGDRYHVTLNCSGIKRNYTIKKLSEVTDKRICKKCDANSSTK